MQPACATTTPDTYSRDKLQVVGGGDEEAVLTMVVVLVVGWWC
jgi:hypothetical protein